jgi:hypothetical protein
MRGSSMPPFEKNISIKNYLEKYYFGIRPYTF